MRFYYFLYFIFIYLLTTSCSKQKSISTVKEYSEWINKAENGCVINKRVNGMVIEIKYLPPSYIALKEWESGNYKEKKIEELLKENQYTTAFLMTFKPDEENNNSDVMFSGVSNYKEYVERSMDLNFDLENKVTLNFDNKKLRPVLSSLENTYGLSKGRSVYLVFAPSENKEELKNIKELDFIYADDIYELGILHYIFNLEDIQKKSPNIKVIHS